MGNLKAKLSAAFGLKTQIVGSDDSYLCSNDLALIAPLEEHRKKLSRTAGKAKRESLEHSDNDNMDDSEAFDLSNLTINYIEYSLNRYPEQFGAIIHEVAYDG